jgi:uncharacterized protein (TIGR00730 family)
MISNTNINLEKVSDKINLTVFCSSKQNLNPIYYSQVEKAIGLLDSDKYIIVYGGGTGGIMGTVRVAWTNKENPGTIISSNVNKFAEPGISDDYLFDNIIDRQKKLVELGQGYLVFAGGYGTHYETLEVITKNDIGEASKPVFILNTNGIFDGFIEHIEKLIGEGFITRDFAKLNIFVESEPNKLIEKINCFFYK